MRATQEVLSRVRISEVYTALTGTNTHFTAGEAWRAPAPWRGGDSPDSVSGDDSKGVWHDFVTNEGGGILDLVTRVRGGSRADALRFVAALAGIKLEDYVLSPADCEQWVRGQRDLERTLPNARFWWRSAIHMTEALLDSLKAALFDSRLQKPSSREVQETEDMLTALRRKDGAELVSEFRWWLENYPDLTAAMVLCARRRDREERRALDALLKADPAYPVVGEGA